MTAPCLNCHDRAVGCKTTCERYIAFRKVIDERKQKYIEIRDRNNIINDFHADSVKKQLKSRGR